MDASAKDFLNLCQTQLLELDWLQLSTKGVLKSNTSLETF